MMDIPTAEDWEINYSDWPSGIYAPESWYACDRFAGKSNAEMLPLFKGNVLGFSEDISWMPKKPFQYYIFCLRDFVIRRDFDLCEGASAASTFLLLVHNKLKHQPEFILPIYADLEGDVRFVAENQELYDADEDIFGNFLGLLGEIQVLAAGR